MDRYHLVTERLDLRPITLADADRLAVLHADARVMNLLKHGVLTRAQSDALVADYAAEWPALGFGSWTATERTGDGSGGRLVGLGGLRVHDGGGEVTMRVAFTPDAQGRGYGLEFGRAVLTLAFDLVGLSRVIAITRSGNLASQRLLEKLGMAREREYEADGRTLLVYAAFNPNSGRTNGNGRTTAK